MRTEALAIVLVAALALPARAEPVADPALAPARFTVALPAEVTVVGLTYGVRPEVLYRPFARGTRTRLRVAVGVLDGPEQLFVPVSLGYRAIFRARDRVRPEVGAGIELQHRIVSDYPTVRQYGCYVEGGVGVAVGDHVVVGAALAIDVMVWGGPGAGLGPRLVVGWTP